MALEDIAADEHAARMKIKNISREEEEMFRAIDALVNEPTTPDIEARKKTLLIENDKARISKQCVPFVAGQNF